MSRASVTGLERVRARRRVAMRTGLGTIALLSLACGVTACIFDQGGDYQKGGRLDKGATAKTAEPEPTVPEPPPTSTNVTDGATPNPLLDAATGG